MIVDSPYIGDWMASAYSIGGKRCDIQLFLNPEGTYKRVVRQEPNYERVDQGRWHHKEDEEVLRLESETPNEEDRISDRWWVLAVTTCEDSNCLMVLRLVALASRNLPILFYRVHLPGRSPLYDPRGVSLEEALGPDLVSPDGATGNSQG